MDVLRSIRALERSSQVEDNKDVIREVQPITHYTEEENEPSSSLPIPLPSLLTDELRVMDVMEQSGPDILSHLRQDARYKLPIGIVISLTISDIHAHSLACTRTTYTHHVHSWAHSSLLFSHACQLNSTHTLRYTPHIRKHPSPCFRPQ